MSLAVGVVLALVPGAAPAEGGSDCSGEWTASTPGSCSFSVSSGNRVIEIRGRAQAVSGPSHVKVEISIPHASPRCEAFNANGPAECFFVLDVTQLCTHPAVCPLPHVHSVVSLTCVASGSPSGTFRCGTG